MSKKSQNKQPKVMTIVGVPFIFDEAHMKQIDMDIVENYGGDVFKAFLQHPYEDIHSDKQGIYAGEKRGQYPFEKVYENLYAYAFWAKNAKLALEISHKMIEKKPSMIKRYPELIRWARAQVLNMVAQQYGMQPICNVPEPQTERIEDTAAVIEQYGGHVADELSTIAIELSKAGAPDTVIYDIVSNTCNKIDAIIAQQKGTIGNYIKQNNLIPAEVEEKFANAQEHHHDCHCGHCEEERSTATNQQAAYTREETTMEKKLKFATIRFVNVGGEAKVEHCEKEFVDGSKDVFDVNKQAAAPVAKKVNVQSQQPVINTVSEQIIPQEDSVAAFTAPKEHTVTCGDFDDFDTLVKKESDIMAQLDDDGPIGIPMPMGNTAPHPNMAPQYPQPNMMYGYGFNYGDPSRAGFPQMSVPYAMAQNIPMYRGSGNF
jgi:hypothetical protein